MSNKKYTTVETETGEVVEGKFYSNEQLEAYENSKHKQTVKNRADRAFTFVEMNKLEKELNNLSLKDLGYLLVMETYIDYMNMLKCKPDDTLPMTREQLGEVLKVGSNKTIVKLIQRFKKQGLIHEQAVEIYDKKYKGIFISDEYCFRKTRDNKNRKTDKAVKLFMSDLQKVYTQTNIKPADIGFIYKTIPYLHYSSNYLVHNPYELDPAKADYVTIDEIAELFGMSRQMVTDRLTRLVYGGKYVFSRTRVGSIREVRLKANPFIIYRQSGDPKELGFEFYVKPKK